MKSQLIVLDMLAHNDWKRPVYYVAGYHNDAFGLEEYFQLEGLAYRLVPIRTENRGWLDYGRIKSDILYDNMMNKFAWGGANDEKVNIDYHHRRTLTVVRARLNYARLAGQLASEGRKEEAVKVLDRCMEVLPVFNVPYDPYFPDLIESYFRAEKTDRAVSLTTDFCNHYYETLDYYLKQKDYIVSSAMYEIQQALQQTSKVADICDTAGQEDLANEINDRVTAYYVTYMGMQAPPPGDDFGELQPAR